MFVIADHLSSPMTKIPGILSKDENYIFTFASNIIFLWSTHTSNLTAKLNIGNSIINCARPWNTEIIVGTKNGELFFVSLKGSGGLMINRTIKISLKTNFELVDFQCQRTSSEPSLFVLIDENKNEESDEEREKEECMSIRKFDIYGNEQQIVMSCGYIGKMAISRSGTFVAAIVGQHQQQLLISCSSSGIFKNLKYPGLTRGGHYTTLIFDDSERSLILGDTTGRITTWNILSKDKITGSPQIDDEALIHHSSQHWHHTGVVSLIFASSSLLSVAEEAVICIWTSRNERKPLFIPRVGYCAPIGMDVGYSTICVSLVDNTFTLIDISTREITSKIVPMMIKPPSDSYMISSHNNNNLIPLNYVKEEKEENSYKCNNKFNTTYRPYEGDSILVSNKGMHIQVYDLKRNNHSHLIRIQKRNYIPMSKKQSKNGNPWVLSTCEFDSDVGILCVAEERPDTMWRGKQQTSLKFFGSSSYGLVLRPHTEKIIQILNLRNGIFVSRSERAICLWERSNNKKEKELIKDNNNNINELNNNSELELEDEKNRDALILYRERHRWRYGNMNMKIGNRMDGISDGETTSGEIEIDENNIKNIYNETQEMKSFIHSGFSSMSSDLTGAVVCATIGRMILIWDCITGKELTGKKLILPVEILGMSHVYAPYVFVCGYTCCYKVNVIDFSYESLIDSIQITSFSIPTLRCDSEIIMIMISDPTIFFITNNYLIQSMEVDQLLKELQQDISQRVNIPLHEINSLDNMGIDLNVKVIDKEIKINKKVIIKIKIKEAVITDRGTIMFITSSGDSLRLILKENSDLIKLNSTEYPVDNFYADEDEEEEEEEIIKSNINENENENPNNNYQKLVTNIRSHISGDTNLRNIMIDDSVFRILKNDDSHSCPSPSIQLQNLTERIIGIGTGKKIEDQNLDTYDNYDNSEDIDKLMYSSYDTFIPSKRFLSEYCEYVNMNK